MRSYYLRQTTLASCLLLLLSIAIPAGSFAYDLLLSSSPDRSSPVFLAGETVEGKIYVFVNPESGINQVSFYIDDPQMNGLPDKVEGFAPYDLGGTGDNFQSLPFDSSQLADGTHELTALVALGSGSSQVIAAGFSVANNVPAMFLSMQALNVTIQESDGPSSLTLDLDTSNGSTTAYTISDDATWLSVTPTAGTTPDSLTVTLDAAGLTAGNYTATITASAAGYAADSVAVTLTVTGSTAPYQQDSGAGGVVSIEVEHYDTSTSPGSHSWVPVFPAGYSGSGALQAQPNTGANINTGYVSTSPRLDYAVNFVKTGIHYVWIRGLGATSADDSVHVGLDGIGVATSDRISNFTPSWTWSGETMDSAVATVNVATTGVHTLNVWMREDGFVMDKLVLTTSSGYTPTGTGPAESPQGNALVLSPQVLTFSVAEGGTTPSQSLNLSASDGIVSAYTVSDDATWLSVTPTAGTTPDLLTASINAAGLAPGTYTGTITAASSGGYTGDTVAVTLSVTGINAAYQQDSGANGIVSIEVENYDTSTSPGSHSWVPVYPTGYSGLSAMQAQPNTGANIDTGYVSTSPMLEVEVNFVKTGTHYVWIRGIGANGNDDSVHVGLNGAAIATSDRMSTFNPTWTWSKATMDGPVATINIPSVGIHTVNVWMREDGFVMDKLVLTTSSSYTPTGIGPAESPQGNALVLSPQVLMFSVAEGGTAPSQSLNLSTSDGIAAGYTVSDDAGWLSVTPSSGTTPGTLTASINAAGLAPGTYTGTITAASSGGYTGDTVAVTLSVTGINAAYQQDSGANGIVSIEVENYDTSTSPGSHSWVPVYPTGYSGLSAMQAQPNTGANIDTGYVSTSPMLEVEVNFVKTGTHYVWIRGIGANGNDDSVHVGLNGAAIATSDRMSTFNPTWTWSKATMDGPVATINIPSVGIHTVNVWMREDGFVMDKLVLTTSSSYTPTGTGPAESPQGNALVLSPQVLMFSVAEGGTAPSQSLNLSTSDGIAAGYTVSDDAGWLSVTPSSGTTPGTLTASINAAGLTAGAYTATITATAAGFQTGTVSVTLTVVAVGSAYDLLLSDSPDRSAAVPLAGGTVAGDIYVFVSPESGINRVSFYIDDPQMSGSPAKVEGVVPYDLGGTGVNAQALPFDSSQLVDGPHELTALVELTAGGSETISASFFIDNSITLPFVDDFTDGNAIGWSITDNSGTLSNWDVNNGAYIQSNFVQRTASALQGAYHLGTYSILQQGRGLTDYRFSVDVTPQIGERFDDNIQGNDIGVMFRFIDNDNYYRFSINSNKGFSRLEKKLDGSFTTLAKDARGYRVGELRNIAVEVAGSIIKVFLDGDALFSAFDPDIPIGSVGLYCQDRSTFDNLLIQAIDTIPSIVISTPPAYSVETAEQIAISAVATNLPAFGSVAFDADGIACEPATESPEGLFQSECFNLAQGEHVLQALLLDGATAVAVDTNINVGTQGNAIVSIGDSITNGKGDRYPDDNVSLDGRIIAVQGYQAVLNDLLSATLSTPTIIFNEGIPGDESVDTLDFRLDSIIARNLGANKALVLLGTNDALAIGIPSGAGCSGASCNGTFKGNLQALIDSLNAAGIQPFIANLPPIWGSTNSSDSMYPDPLNGPLNLEIQEYNGVIDSELAGASPGPDFFNAFLTTSTNLISLYDDMLHPNSLGHVVMAYLWHDALVGAQPLGLPFILSELQANTAAPYVQQNLLAEGSRYYVDEIYTLTQVPEILLQGRWIMAANADKTDATTNYLSFAVDRPVTVYVAIDANAPDTPAWLSPFTQTGLEIRVDNPVSGSFDLYSRVYPAGTIVLGGNRQGVSASPVENYIAIVVDN